MSLSLARAVGALRRAARHADGNVSGQAYGLTMFAAIAPGQAEAVAAELAGWGDGGQSPLARLRQLHCSRVHVLDELVYQGDPQVPEPLQSSYLVFTASFDGGLDEFLDDVVAEMATEADALWRHCVGYPGTDDARAFRGWVRHNQVDNHYFLGHYPDATVREVRQGLEARTRVAEFAARAQGMDTATLHREFLAEFGHRGGRR